MSNKLPPKSARRFIVKGQVQGVGFRYFVEKNATAMGLDGFVRNLDDGSVEVYALGAPAELDALAGLLWTGPRWAEVRSVESREDAVLKYRGFHIEH